MKPWTPAPHLALLLSAQAEALGTDYLKLIYADGVFQGVSPLPAEQLMRGERGYALTPSVFGGEWSLTLGASAQQKELADKVHLTFVGNTAALAETGATIGKLMARLSSAAASRCFHVGSERLPALKSWVESSVKSGARADLNTERSFGPLRVQLLTHHGGGGAETTQNLAEVDVLLSRAGQPGIGA